MTDNYVNNREFQQLIINYKVAKQNNPKIKVPDQIRKDNHADCSEAEH